MDRPKRASCRRGSREGNGRGDTETAADPTQRTEAERNEDADRPDSNDGERAGWSEADGPATEPVGDRQQSEPEAEPSRRVDRPLVSGACLHGVIPATTKQ